MNFRLLFIPLFFISVANGELSLQYDNSKNTISISVVHEEDQDEPILKNLISKLKSLKALPKNFYLHPEVSEIPLPEMELHQIPPMDVLKFLIIATEKYYGNLILKDVNGISYFTFKDDIYHPTEIISFSPYLTHYTHEDILAAIDAVIEFQYGNDLSQTKLRYHVESKLLFVQAEDRALNLIHSVLENMTPDESHSPTNNKMDKVLSEFGLPFKNELTQLIVKYSQQSKDSYKKKTQQEQNIQEIKALRKELSDLKAKLSQHGSVGK